MTGAPGRLGGTPGVRPELEALTGAEKDRVLRAVGRRRPACPGCDGHEFAVGHALYLGFLFLSEERDAYMVALTCANPTCPRPRSGINLHDDELR